MCGISGFSLVPGCDIDRSLLGKSLMAGVAERGADAAGYAWSRQGEKDIYVHKQIGGAADLLPLIEIADDADSILLHVRDFTKGAPSIMANNHPIRHGHVVGIHNGRIQNDDTLLAAYGIARAEPEMTVDSEAIFAVVNLEGPSVHALQELQGSYACAWIDDRDEDAVYVVLGTGRPLWLAIDRCGVFFASTASAFSFVDRYTGLSLHPQEVTEGVMFSIVSGQIVEHELFEPRRDYQERGPSLLAHPDEQRRCLELLDSMTAAGR